MSIPIWKKILKENFTSLMKLASFLELDNQQQELLSQNKTFPLNLPRRLADKIQKKSLLDPILLQFVPFKSENKKSATFVKDPVGDCLVARTPKYLQKYSGRVLLLLTGACAMHCRYCFRQNYSYASFQTGFTKELEFINNDSSIKEVILSGGDPLCLGNSQLKELIDQIAKIPHVTRLRFHTRFPIGIPERIDEEFLKILQMCNLQVWFVIHCNHPNELDLEIFSALKKIQKLGIPVLNQFVLLKGINDSTETLHILCEKLVNQGVQSYYLHQLDRVEGASHFEVNQERGRHLISELNKRISGYAVPKYVQEIPSELSKISLI